MTIEDAKQIANGLIQSYIGPDSRVVDMPSFYGALVQALQAAHQQGWKDRGEEGKGAIAMTEWNEDFSVEAFRKLDEIKPLDPGLSGRVALSYTQLSLIIDRMGRELTDAVAFWKLARKAGAVADD